MYLFIMAMERDPRGIKVGEVAKRTGLTVRTLHHYDELGLLSPSAQTESGHRLYTAEDLEKLQRIVSFRQLGFSLEEIRELLGGGSLRQVVELHLESVRDQLAQSEALCRKLELLSSRLQAGAAPSIDELLSSVEATMKYEQFFTPDQLATLKDRFDKLGPNARSKSQQEWTAVAQKAKALRDRGVDPASSEAVALGREFKSLVEEITGGDDGIRGGLTKIYRSDPEAHARYLGIDVEVFRWLGQAMRAAKA